MIKLTFEDATDIRNEYAKGDISERILGQKYAVARTTISDVICATTWNHTKPYPDRRGHNADKLVPLTHNEVQQHVESLIESITMLDQQVMDSLVDLQKAYSKSHQQVLEALRCVSFDCF